MAEAMLALAAVGVDVLRWTPRRSCGSGLGTNCQNQPEVHELLQAFRAALRIAAPAVAFKAEAIVAPRDLVPYLGTGRHEGKECDLAYHNVLMVLLWSALASGRVALMTSDAEGDAARPARRRLADVRALPRRHRLGDHARGRRRASARTPTCTGASWPTSTRASSPARSPAAPASSPTRGRGEARTCGSGASLAGLEIAPDEVAVDLAIRRILLLHAVAFAHGGLPLIYMGDELGLLNDAAYLDDPHKPRQPLDAPAADGLGGRVAPARPGDRRGPALGRPATPGRGPPRHPRDPRPGRHRAAVDRQRARLRALPRAGRRVAARAGELHRRPQPVALEVCRRGFALTDAAAEATAARSRAYRDFVVLAPYQHSGSQDFPRIPRLP